MDPEQKTLLTKAVNLLISSPNAHKHFQTMLNAAPLMARHPEVNLTGEAAALNPLARLKVGDPETYDSILDLVERKRESSGHEPLQTDDNDKFDRGQYMQEFMQQKRLRERRAAEIENMQRGDRDKLKGRSRLDFMQRQSAVWKQGRDALLARAKEAQAPSRLTRPQMTVVLDQFWSKVDAQLDGQEALARQGKRVGPISLAELDAALRHDPYK